MFPLCSWLENLDTLSPSQRSERMKQVRGRNTKPEMAVRRLAHGLGYRYRLHRRDLPGKPDLVFGPRKKVIFVHGCFWHRHPDPNCKLARMPKSRLEFWGPKLKGNRERDVRQLAALEAKGWEYLVVWECETADRASLATRLREFLGQ
ncbi:very short patch repair endonuclease [Amorphus suaedae]